MPCKNSGLAVVTLVMLLSSFLRRTANAWVARGPSQLSFSSPRRHSVFSQSRIVLRSSRIDEEGRRIRSGGARRTGGGWDNAEDDGGWDDFDPAPSKQQRGRGPDRNNNDAWDDDGGWDDFDPFGGDGGERSTRSRRDSSGPSRGRSNSGGRDRRSPPSRGDSSNRHRSESSSRNRRNNKFASSRGGQDKERKINMKALEGAGFVHLYGLASVLNALQAGRRDFTRPEDTIDIEELQGEEYEHELLQRERKPEAQYSPWLFVQEQQHRGSGRSSDKQSQADKLLELAEQQGVPVATVDKGVLNTLSGNRPHQGYVLRCGKLFFESLSRIMPPSEDDPDAPNLWLVLDEVVDPQNLGALIRSAYFLGGAKKIGILVCAKNSAPPSPVVSAASAGALELVNIYSTSNLPKTLASAEQDGFRIVGASSSVPKEMADDVALYDLQDLPEPKAGQPTILVLGSEGRGLRNLVARSCTDFVRIPAGSGAEGVDSLNVSVTGGILLWNFIQVTLRDD